MRNGACSGWRPPPATLGVDDFSTGKTLRDKSLAIALIVLPNKLAGQGGFFDARSFESEQLVLSLINALP